MVWCAFRRPAPLAADHTRTLLDVITSAPAQELGSFISQDFEGHLPFLLKVLAAEKPLSLQAHPSTQQAQEGFARENAQGVPLKPPTATTMTPTTNRNSLLVSPVSTLWLDSEIHKKHLPSLMHLP